MFNKLSLKWMVVVGLFFSDLSALSYRNALQMPESYIGEINDFAIDVNSSSDLRLRGVGSCLDKGDSVVCAFSKVKTKDTSASALIDEIADIIAEEFPRKEIVLTGYGSAALYAVAVASRLSQKSLETNQLKLITFCVDTPFYRLDRICLPCKLNFSHKFAKHDYQNSPWIELPISFSSELCSIRSVVAGITGGLVFGAIGSFCAQKFGMGKPFAYVCSLCGAIATTLEMPRHCFAEYLPSTGVRSVFVHAKKHSWKASTESEWRMLGQ